MQSTEVVSPKVCNSYGRYGGSIRGRVVREHFLSMSVFVLATQNLGPPTPYNGCGPLQADSCQGSCFGPPLPSELLCPSVSAPHWIYDPI